MAKGKEMTLCNKVQGFGIQTHVASGRKISMQILLLEVPDFLLYLKRYIFKRDGKQTKTKKNNQQEKTTYTVAWDKNLKDKKKKKSDLNISDLEVN